ncbi:hypothetical protein TIFTF001_039022 [Ficus carica]|uniref:Uncharacterized protein n=1 Tax=Ficus carica TaxID=3494 RepID=A0AA88E8C8_FICCA|nr:hypothetical protein TIFTF001_039022 [Ficus carica]
MTPESRHGPGELRYTTNRRRYSQQLRLIAIVIRARDLLFKAPLENVMKLAATVALKLPPRMMATEERKSSVTVAVVIVLQKKKNKNKKNKRTNKQFQNAWSNEADCDGAEADRNDRRRSVFSVTDELSSGDK